MSKYASNYSCLDLVIIQPPGELKMGWELGALDASVYRLRLSNTRTYSSSTRILPWASVRLMHYIDQLSYRPIPVLFPLRMPLDVF